VHGVIPELDAGPVLAQVRIAIHADDTAETLAQRLIPEEHRLLVACVAGIAAGRYAWREDGFHADGQRLAHPLVLRGDRLEPAACA
jgi:phosphoribosylglycinamide formyltransferase-1